MSLYDEVYGLKYNAAVEQMGVLSAAMLEQAGRGFPDIDTLEDWAHSHLLDKVVYSSMSHQFMCVSHKGELIQPNTFDQYYGNILYYNLVVGKQTKMMPWRPTGYKFFDKAYMVGEQSDGIHKPLYYRDYTVPTGYYSPDRDAFNIAKPFPVFAQETGKDTSHIYTYLRHISGECYMWLLAWLRAKLLYPTVKTQVVPIIISRTQGSGKTTFAEVICKGLFGKSNVIVSDQYDATARFNADYADALIVCQEEKEETDKRNPAGTLKSRATATTIRKELKGVDPIYQESYTDFIMTTNKDVPIKFDGREDQRRFMVMEADENFTRKTSELADEVFTKLYGYDASGTKKGIPFQEDSSLIAQFKHELFSREDIAAIKLREFPKTDAYKRCYTLPRTSESVDIESIMRSLAPFIRNALLTESVREEIVTDTGRTLCLNDVLQYAGAMQYMPAYKDYDAYVALCRPMVFYDMATNRPYSHSVVERGLYDCATWLKSEYGIQLVKDMDPLPGGFTRIAGRYSSAPAARFALVGASATPDTSIPIFSKPNNGTARMGKRLRVNNKFIQDEKGCYETVNEMKEGITSLKGNKSKNVQYMDTFLLESDTPTVLQEALETKRAAEYIEAHGKHAKIEASVLYKERLETALAVSEELFNSGKVARVVYSGAKSYHLMIRVSESPRTLPEYKWLHAYLASTVTDKLIFDSSTSDPARLTRSPITLERSTEAYDLSVQGTQRLIFEDWSHVLNIKWRNLYEHWLNRPLKVYEKAHGKPLYPTRPEYQDALEALVDGSFWTSSSYNGRRQELFFPCYRLLRVLGYSANEAWDNVILPKLSSYIKPNEIGYWQSRRTSALIASIDADIDRYNDEWENKK